MFDEFNVVVHSILRIYNQGNPRCIRLLFFPFLFPPRARINYRYIVERAYNYVSGGTRNAVEREIERERVIEGDEIRSREDEGE